MQRKKFIFYWLPVILWSAAIMYASTRPLDVPTYLPSQDKVAHFIVYALLGMLFIRALHDTFHSINLRIMLFTICIVALFGAAIEIIQIYCNRFFEWYDIFANTIGACLGTVGYRLIKGRFVSQKPK